MCNIIMDTNKISNEKLVEMLPDIFSILTEEQTGLILSNIQIQEYLKNDIIYQEGEMPAHLLCLLCGKVKIFKNGAGGRSQIMRVMNAVEYFGFRAAFSGQTYNTGAAAFEQSTIATIPLSIIESIIKNNSQLAWFFIRKLATALGQSDERTVSLTQKHIRGRLAESILFLKDQYGVEDDGNTLCICPSRKDLANLSNMTTSNAIRTLSLFVSEGLVVVDGRKITIQKEEELKRISRLG